VEVALTSNRNSGASTFAGGAFARSGAKCGLMSGAGS